MPGRFRNQRSNKLHRESGVTEIVGECRDLGQVGQVDPADRDAEALFGDVVSVGSLPPCQAARPINLDHIQTATLHAKSSRVRTVQAIIADAQGTLDRHSPLHRCKQIASPPTALGSSGWNPLLGLSHKRKLFVEDA